MHVYATFQIYAQVFLLLNHLKLLCKIFSAFVLRKIANLMDNNANDDTYYTIIKIDRESYQKYNSFFLLNLFSTIDISYFSFFCEEEIIFAQFNLVIWHYIAC